MDELVGGVRVTETVARPLCKLAVERQGRWYPVNGLPNDRIDRRLLQRMGKAPAD